MEIFQIRTDLALEARESVNEEESKLRGVSVDEHYEEETDIRITKVTIDTKNAEKTLGKPMGVYVTMEAPAMVEPDDDYHREISEALAEELLKMMPGEAEELSVLIVGLGNREVTADALGPQVVDNLLITRHVVRAYGKAAYNCTRMNLVSSIEPGVMAKTGMETAEIISGVVKETQPDVLIAVDALAARSTRRLNRTIQITNTGIQPGSGVGNHRNALTEETLGVPVIAIGIPTVVDAATIVGDALEKLMSWKEPGRSRMDILKMAPRKLYEEYIEARRQPYMIHFAGYQKPWDVADCDFAEYFWEYAKNSSYFATLLSKCTTTLSEGAVLRSSLKNIPVLRKAANRLLPYGSRRRELIKKFDYNLNK